MKYPIDPITTEHIFGQLIIHERSQRQIITALSLLLQDAMDDALDEQTTSPWFKEARDFLKAQNSLKKDHETRIFNEKNGHVQPETVKLTPEVANKNYQNTMPTFGLGQIEDHEFNKKLNEHEASFGGEMSEEDIEKMFNERPKRKKKDRVDLSDGKPFKNMSLEEIEDWESKQNNSNDIYKIKARVANLARSGGGSLTAVGEMLCNSFVHVAKDLYEFADTISDKSLRIQLIERIRKHEGMPAQLIAATAVNVKVKK